LLLPIAAAITMAAIDCLKHAHLAAATGWLDHCKSSLFFSVIIAAAVVDA